MMDNFACGHPKTPENTKANGRNTVRCRLCQRRWEREASAKRKAAYKGARTEINQCRIVNAGQRVELAQLRALLTEKDARIEKLEQTIIAYEAPNGWRSLMARDARRVTGDVMVGVFMAPLQGGEPR